MFGLLTLMAQCVHPAIPPEVMTAVVEVESSGNPYAIGVVGRRLVRQPENIREALSAVAVLKAGGWNYSVGLAQVNRYNLSKHGLSDAAAFDGCSSLRAGSAILKGCLDGAAARYGADNALPYALSCYYSGNFSRGFRPDRPGDASYVDKVLMRLKPNITDKEHIGIYDLQPMMY